VKLKQGGSAAGHNGLKDIVAQLGTTDFWRLRLGIGHPGVKSEVIHYVLKKPSPEHRAAIDQCIVRTLDALDLLLAGAMERAMMKIHTKPPLPKTAPPAAGSSREKRGDPMHVQRGRTVGRRALAGCWQQRRGSAESLRCGPDGSIYSQTPCADGYESTSPILATPNSARR